MITDFNLKYFLINMKKKIKLFEPSTGKDEENSIKDKKKEYFDTLVLIGPTYLLKKELNL